MNPIAILSIFSISILFMMINPVFTPSNHILHEVFAIEKNAPTPTILSAIDGDGLDLTKTKIVSSHPKITFQFSTGDKFFWENACKLDNHPWKTCSSPITHELKSPGNHKFSVKVYLKDDPNHSLCPIANPGPKCIDTLSWTFER